MNSKVFNSARVNNQALGAKERSLGEVTEGGEGVHTVNMPTKEFELD